MTNLNDIQIGVLTPEGVQPPTAVKFKKIYDGDVKEVFDAGNVGECRLLVEIIDLDEAVGIPSDTKRYVCQIMATKKKHRLTKKQRESIMSSFGIEWEQVQYTDIMDYGYAAPLDTAESDSNDFTAWINETLPRVKMLFGFYMDRAVNRIGNDGWDFINGNIGWGKRK